MEQKQRAKRQQPALVQSSQLRSLTANNLLKSGKSSSGWQLH